MTKGYHSRRKEKRNEYKILIVVCEGLTEKIYINNFRERNCGLKIKTPHTKVSDPVNLVKFALTQIQKEELSLNEGDAIWCVFDADHHNNNELLKAKQIAGEKVKICFSNPCFELWFLLHFFDQKNRISSQDLITKLEKYINKYDKIANYYEKLMPRMSNAINRAEKLNQRYNEILKTKSNPSTQIFELIKFIRSIIEENRELKDNCGECVKDSFSINTPNYLEKI